MTLRPSAPDPPRSHPLGEEATELPSSTIMRNVEASHSPRAGQWWRQISAEEWQARHEEYKRRLAELDAQDDTPEEVYDEIMRNLEALNSPKGQPSEQPLSTTGPTDAGDSPAAEWPYRDVDPRTGRLRPISAEERQARYEAYKQRLAEIDAEDDTPEEVYDQIERNIDEERRRQGRPPAFEGSD